ncbi:hypothetical protein TNCV_1210291 [Trichonephila clavipes]|nr:hypothetical protein TNCV_1210291 [Trichonephila clavipes]
MASHFRENSLQNSYLAYIQVIFSLIQRRRGLIVSVSEYHTMGQGVEQGSFSHTDFHVLHGRALPGVRYRNEDIDGYIHPYAAAIGKEFILIDDAA